MKRLTKLSIYLICTQIAFLVNAQTELPVKIPPQTEILKTLKKEHPRLCATKEDFNRVKQSINTDPILSKWYKDIYNQGKRILNDPPSQYEIPDGLRLLATSRRVMNRIYTLGFLYRIDGDKRWFDRAWKELETAANFKDWNPRHFLDTAEMTHAFAIGYDWFYDELNESQRQTLRQAMIEKGIKPALDIHNKKTGWTRARHNWNQVCNGGTGIGALAIADVEPELASQLLYNALNSIQLAMAEYGPDGAWAEGPGYWNYATSYNVYFLAALKTALGTDFGLTKIDGFSNAGDFPVYMTGQLNRTFNYADSGDGAPRAPALFWLAKEFKKPIYAYYQTKLASPSALDILWYEKTPQNISFSNLPLDKYFRHAEVVSFRSKWDEPEAIFIGFKAGYNKANHSNLDLGTFVLDALGVRWALDLGADNYNLPGYFGKQRWDYYRLRAEGHNTIVINPDKLPDQIPSADAKIVKFDSKPARAIAVADLSKAYARNASKVQRGIMLLDRKRVIIQDEIKALQPSLVYWFMHTPAKIELSQDKKTATLTQGKSTLLARVIEPENVSFSIMPAEPLETSPKPEKQAQNRNISKLTISVPQAVELKLVVELIPVIDKSGLPAPTGTKPLSEW